MGKDDSEFSDRQQKAFAAFDEQQRQRRQREEERAQRWRDRFSEEPPREVQQQSAPPPSEFARGLVDSTTLVRIYSDGTYAYGGVFGKAKPADVLLAFDHDADSMRRKSVTGRGTAALLTGGLSLAASNNRGVVYVTILGQQAGTRTFTTRNPSGTQLTGIRSLKAAADHVLAEREARQASQPVKPPPAVGADLATQLRQLGDLHATGVLSDDEFAAAKARLLS